MYLKIGPNWPNLQFCLTGSSKMAPRILIFSIAMGAEYLSYVKFIATRVPTFFGYIISVLASVPIEYRSKHSFINECTLIEIAQRMTYMKLLWFEQFA